MRKCCNIVTAFLLLFTILVNSIGLTLVRCAHSGRTSVLTVAGLMADDDGCAPVSDCMTVNYIQQAPAHYVPAASFGFHPFQPLIALLPDFVIVPHPAAAVKALQEAVAHPVNAPPRAYLNLLCILLI